MSQIDREDLVAPMENGPAHSHRVHVLGYSTIQRAEYNGYQNVEGVRGIQLYSNEYCHFD